MPLLFSLCSQYNWLREGLLKIYLKKKRRARQLVDTSLINVSHPWTSSNNSPYDYSYEAQILWNFIIIIVINFLTHFKMPKLNVTSPPCEVNRLFSLTKTKELMLQSHRTLEAWAQPGKCARAMQCYLWVPSQDQKLSKTRIWTSEQADLPCTHAQCFHWMRHYKSTWPWWR